MLAKIKAPQLRNPNIVFRLAKEGHEIRQADQLVFYNYLDVGLWTDEKEFRENRYLHSPMRTVFVAVENGKVLATVSTIRDSSIGLPADKFQPEIMKRLRSAGERIAEVSALAVDRSASKHERTLVLFLYKFLYQYSFFYAETDRFVATTTPKHAFFYESVCGFQKLSDVTDYYYVKLGVQLLTAHLIRDREPLATRYDLETERDGKDSAERNFYHFLLIDEHPNIDFPDRSLMRRRRDVDWLVQAKLMRLPVAV